MTTEGSSPTNKQRTQRSSAPSLTPMYLGAALVGVLTILPACFAIGEDDEAAGGRGSEGHARSSGDHDPTSLDEATLLAIRAREPERAAAARAARIADLGLASVPGADLVIERVHTDVFGMTHVNIQLTIDGVPLHGMRWIEHVGPQEQIDRPAILKGWKVPDIARSTAEISPDEAVRRTNSAAHDAARVGMPQAQLYYYSIDKGETWRLVYLVTTRRNDKGTLQELRQAVSAESGEVLGEELETSLSRHHHSSLSHESTADPEGETCQCLGTTVIGPSHLDMLCFPEQTWDCFERYDNGGGRQSRFCANGIDQASIECQTQCVNHASAGDCGVITRPAP